MHNNYYCVTMGLGTWGRFPKLNCENPFDLFSLDLQTPLANVIHDTKCTQLQVFSSFILRNKSCIHFRVAKLKSAWLSFRLLCSALGETCDNWRDLNDLCKEGKASHVCDPFYSAFEDYLSKNSISLYHKFYNP